MKAWLLTIAVSLCFCLPVRAQTEADSVFTLPEIPMAPTLLDSAAKAAAVDSISAPWNGWTTVALSGKFKMAGLPLSPSVKIFMQRDSIILISLRAPLMGEAGRAEITPDTVTVVNKTNQTFMQEPLEAVLAGYPGSLSDVQDLLLGRMVIPGAGLLSRQTEEAVDIYAEPDGTLTVVGAEEFRIPGFNYGYAADSSFANCGLMVIPEGKDVSVSLAVNPLPQGYALAFDYRSDTRNYAAELQFNSLQWDASPFGRIKLGRQYRRLQPEEFINYISK